MSPHGIATLTVILFLCSMNNAQKTRYISTERPTVEYYNKEYIRYANITTIRYSRRDPFYYVGMVFDMLYEFHNNLTVEFIFYELLSNRYRRSFVEMHFKACDFIHKDKFFGSAFKQGPLDRPCPFPAGVYQLYNMTVPTVQIPGNFPFTKGRIYANFTGTYNKAVLGYGHIDMEIKESYNIGKRKPSV